MTEILMVSTTHIINHQLNIKTITINIPWSLMVSTRHSIIAVEGIKLLVETYRYY